MPLYSVWKPAVSSDSASIRSNGVRFISAEAATRKTKNPSGCSTMNGSCCASTTSTSDMLPAKSSTPASETIIGTS